jgi:CRISPR-associated protein Cmr1
MLAKIAFDVELLTPAFIGGPTPRRLDEHMPLRPSTVRGMLRWWFRAAAGALLWPRDDSPDAQARAIEALSKAESAVFGNTERASPVVVLPPEGGAPEDIPPPDPAKHPGVRYLGYGLFDDRSIVPQALRTPPPLQLTLGLRRERAGVRELLGATVWLWMALGGLGARSRRGFGSLKLAGRGTDLGWPEELRREADTHAGLEQQLMRGLKWATEVFRSNLPAVASYPLEVGSRPHPELRTIAGIDRVTVLPVDAGSGREALERTGRLFRDFRSTLRRRDLGMPPLADYFTVKTSLQSRRPPAGVDRAAFGLPLPFYFRSLGGEKATFQPYHDDSDRLASPLLFRIHALGRDPSQRYVAVLVNLAGARTAHPLLGGQLVERRMGRPFPAPDGQIIQQFISWARAEVERAPYARRRDR